jgi:hypothetical protein
MTKLGFEERGKPAKTGAIIFEFSNLNLTWVVGVQS